jgi:hypothetical protein
MAAGAAATEVLRVQPFILSVKYPQTVIGSEQTLRDISR